MKVYAVNLPGFGSVKQFRGIVAADNKREAAKAFGMSYNEFNQYWAEADAFERSAAMPKFGVVLARPLDNEAMPYCEYELCVTHARPR